VIGHANTVTVSRRLPKDGGAVIDVRLDMVKEIGDFKTVVGCHLASPPGPELDALKTKLGGSFVVRGTLKEITFGNPQLNPCTIVSQ